MGLDMYLEAKLYLSKYSGDKELFEKVYELEPYKYTENVKSVSLEFPVGYWRKANWIHKWFVDNVQGGDDDCGSYTVSLPELKQLMDVCYEVITDNSKADELLPTTSGFFFGSTNYDEFYFTQVTNTYKILKELVDELEKYKTPLNNRAWIEYQASW